MRLSYALNTQKLTTAVLKISATSLLCTTSNESTGQLLGAFAEIGDSVDSVCFQPLQNLSTELPCLPSPSRFVCVKKRSSLLQRNLKAQGLPVNTCTEGDLT